MAKDQAAEMAAKLLIVSKHIAKNIRADQAKETGKKGGK
jgi:hypothetical protein